MITNLLQVHVKSSLRLPNLLRSICMLFFIPALFSSCGIYSFRNATIPADVKTVNIKFIQNTARYINPQLGQKFYDKIQQKIIGSTKLTRSNSDDAHYVISGTITTYDANQTVGINAQQATTNRLTVTLHMVLKKTLENKTDEFDVSRSFDYSANLSLQQAEGQLLDEVVRSLTDDIFNRIFSNW